LELGVRERVDERADGDAGGLDCMEAEVEEDDDDAETEETAGIEARLARGGDADAERLDDGDDDRERDDDRG